MGDGLRGSIRLKGFSGNGVGLTACLALGPQKPEGSLLCDKQ